MEYSLTGDYSMDSKDSSSQGELLFLEGLQGATERNPGASKTPLSWVVHLSPGSPSSENLEVLAEKVGTLDLKSIKKTCSGVVKKRGRRARLAEAPTGDSVGGQPQQGPSRGPPQPQSSQTQTLNEPGTSGTQTNGKEKLPKCGPSATEPKLSKSKGPSQGPGKCQRLSRSTPQSKQVNKSRQTGQLRYARAAREGLQVVINCDGYPQTQVSKEKLVSIQRIIGRLEEELSEEGSPPGSLIPIGLKGLPLWYAKMRRPGIGWVVKCQP